MGSEGIRGDAVEGFDPLNHEGYVMGLAGSYRTAESPRYPKQRLSSISYPDHPRAQRTRTRLSQERLSRDKSRGGMVG